MVLTATMGLALILGGAKSPFAQTVSPQNNKQSVETAPSKKQDTQVGESVKSQNPSASQSSTQGLGNPQTPSTQGLGNPQTPSTQGQGNPQTPSAQGQKSGATQEVKPDAKAQTPSASSASTQEQGNKAATYTPTVTQADVDGLPRLKVLNRVVQAEQTGFNAAEAIKKKLGENATPEATLEELIRILRETNYDYYLVVEQSATEPNGTYHFLSTMGVPVKNQDWDIVVDILLDQPKDGPVTGEAFITIKQKDGTEGAMEVSLTKLAEYFKYLTGTDAKAARAIPIIAGDKVAIIIYGCAFPDAPLLSGQPVVRVGVNTSDRTTLRSQNPIEIIE
jgi:hypothetical protein